MQTPTVGRRMWYKPCLADFSTDGLVQLSQQPFDAGVVHVNEDESVNLVVTDHYGTQRYREAVWVFQGDSEQEEVPEGFAYWMPYQRRQHEKHAAEG